MTVYMVKRKLPGVTIDVLAAAQRRAIDTAADMSQQGTPVRYLRSTFVPEESSCMCLFDAGSADVVEQLNRKAEIPFDRVVEALDLTP